jgi:transformation/transcription domain-associated protein
MKEALAQVELSCPKEISWKIHLYRGYLAICSTDDQNLPVVDRYVEGASNLCIKDWRRLPHLVSNVHVSILQAAQQVSALAPIQSKTLLFLISHCLLLQIVELHEATQIHQALIHGRANTLHDMKAVVKTWRNRLPCISDDLSHWSDIFTWRQQHYQFIANHFDSQSDQNGGNQTMLGVHASAQVTSFAQC